jgi:exopolyphosphatase/guanosine-5'-triphosphate,3'-diphosphate pyrophosphatase
VRRRSIIELGERCNYWPVHARQVARLSLALFDATQPTHELGPREREWLEYAALLHDIGALISYEGHHKHSEYLIRNGDLRGFDPAEIDVIGLVARYHRQTTPKKSHEGYGELPRALRRTVKLLGAIVRLAEGLDRSHAQVISDLTLARAPEALVITLHTSGDAELELWAAHRHAAALAELFETEIRFEAAPAAPGRSKKDTTPHAEPTRHPTHAPRPPVRRRGHRRLGEDHAARPAREVADRERA